MSEQRQFTRDDGVTLAMDIEMIKSVLHTIDWDAAEHFQKEIAKAAADYDAAAALNQMYIPEYGRLLKAQAEGFKLLIDFKNKLQLCDELKQSVDVRKRHIDQMNPIFLQ